MKPFYQLVSTGETVCFGGRKKYHSRRIFTTPEAASGYIEEFRTLCTDHRTDQAADLFALDAAQGIQVKVIELVCGELE